MLPIAVTGQIVDVSSTESNKKTLSSWCCAFLGHKLLTVWIGQVLFTIDTCTFIECWVAPVLSDFNFLCQKNVCENQFLIFEFSSKFLYWNILPIYYLIGMQNSGRWPIVYARVYVCTVNFGFNPISSWDDTNACDKSVARFEEFPFIVIK